VLTILQTVVFRLQNYQKDDERAIQSRYCAAGRDWMLSSEALAELPHFFCKV
jgi:hypothetical protein